MSVCFFLPSEPGASSAVPEVAAESEMVMVDEACGDTITQSLEQFWTKVMDDVKKTSSDDFKTQALPLARIKKIMKLDEEVKMISAEAPVLFAKAAEIFIHELTLKAWAHTEDNKRRTLQRNDIAMAISKSDQFDFLIDIVPRHEVKPVKREETVRTTTTTEQVTTQPQQTVIQNSSQPQIVLQPCTQVLQGGATVSSTVASSNVGVTQQPVTLLQQLVTPSGEVQQLPIQLTQAQLNTIRMQMQNNPSQPIIIQAQPQQIIQVSSQQQHPQPQVFVQVGSQDES